MGFFSWQTADTEESIYNRYTDKCRPVYLIEPDSSEHEYEEAYEGYGFFGSVDAHDWLALNNVPLDLLLTEFGKDHSNADPEAMRQLGLGLFIDSLFYQDVKTGLYIRIGNSAASKIGAEIIARDKGMKASAFIPAVGGYDAEIAGIGESWNSLKEQERLIEFAVPCPFPLKFSFNKEAKYEDFPASKNCPNQGFFQCS